MADISDLDIKAVQRISDAIKPLLKGRGAEIQGAVLAELLSTWLGGHLVPGSIERTKDLQRELLDMHVAAVSDLVDLINEERRSDGIL